MDSLSPSGTHRNKEMSGLTRSLCIGALILGAFLTALDLSIISTAIPRITSDFHSLDDVGWYGSIFFLATAVFQPVWGKVYMHLDIKYVLLTTLVIFELGTLGCAIAKDSPSFIASRAVAGFGGAGIFNGVYTMISHIVQPETMPAFFGLVGLAFTVSGVLGPILGGVFTSHVTWRWCFYINLPICGVVIAILIVFLKLPSTAKPKKVSPVDFLLNLDLIGVTTIIGSLLCFLFALELGGIKYTWSSSVVVGTLVGWIVLAIISVGTEYVQADRAILPRKFFRERGVAMCSVFIFCFNAGMYYRMYFLPIQFQAIYGMSAERSGIVFLALLVPTSIFSMLAGAVLAKIGYYQPLLLVGSAIATVGSGLLYTLGVDYTFGKIIGYQILVGIGDGIVVQIPVTAVQAFASAEDIPSVTGAILFWQLCGGMTGIVAGQSIFSNKLLQKLPQDAPGVSAAEILRIGAYSVSQAVPPELLQGVRQTYLACLRGGWAMTIAFCAAAFVSALFVPSISISGRIGAVKSSSDSPESTESTETEAIGEERGEKSVDFAIKSSKAAM